MEEITLNVLLAEAKDIVNVLGQLPTQSNAFPLFQKLKAQVDNAEALLNKDTPAT